MGITPDRFWRMTPREVVVAIEGHARALEDQWDIARHETMWLVNCIIGVLGGEANKQPTDFVRFAHEMPREQALSQGDYDRSMIALKMREESAIYWGSPEGAPRDEVLNPPPIKPRSRGASSTRGRKRATLKR